MVPSCLRRLGGEDAGQRRERVGLGGVIDDRFDQLRQRGMQRGPHRRRQPKGDVFLAVLDLGGRIPVPGRVQPQHHPERIFERLREVQDVPRHLAPIETDRWIPQAVRAQPLHGNGPSRSDVDRHARKHVLTKSQADLLAVTRSIR